MCRELYNIYHSSTRSGRTAPSLSAIRPTATPLPPHATWLQLYSCTAVTPKIPIRRAGLAGSISLLRLSQWRRAPAQESGPGARTILTTGVTRREQSRVLSTLQLLSSSLVSTRSRTPRASPPAPPSRPCLATHKLCISLCVSVTHVRGGALACAVPLSSLTVYVVSVRLCT